MVWVLVFKGFRLRVRFKSRLQEPKVLDLSLQGLGLRFADNEVKGLGTLNQKANGNSIDIHWMPPDRRIYRFGSGEASTG